MSTEPVTQPTADELGAALTSKHLAFCENYFKCNFNASAAARATGYKNHAEGGRLMMRADIQAYISARMTQYMAADEVMQRLTALARTDGSHFLKAEEYEVPVYAPAPLQERVDISHRKIEQFLAIDPEQMKGVIDAEWAKIAEREVQLALDPQATYQKQVGTEMRIRYVPSLEAAAENGVLFAIESAEYTPHGLKFKRQDNVKALELIGRHHKLFTDKVETSGPDGGPVEIQITRHIVGGES